MVDEKTLYDTFSRFGSLIQPPKIARDESQLSKGYGFVSYSNFEASDDAIANMNGQYLMNKDISVQYAYKKDGKGERHGDEAERMLASQAKKHNVMPDLPAMPSQLLNGGLPPAPISMDTHSPAPQMGMGGMGGPPPNLPPGFSGRPNGNYNSALPPTQQRSNVPLPIGLPQRPPPSQAGYGGPQDYHPPGFAPPPGYPPQGMPPGFGPPGGPPQQMPPGFMPQGFQQQQQAPPGYGGRR
jgi:splicing factor 3B subunit 4